MRTEQTDLDSYDTGECERCDEITTVAHLNFCPECQLIVCDGCYRKCSE